MFERLLDAFIEQFSPSEGSVWDSVLSWKTSTIVLALVLVGLLTFRKQVLRWVTRNGRREADRGVFERADALMSERQVLSLLDELARTHSYLFGEMEPLKCFARFFREEGNQYLDKGVRSRLERTLEVLNALWEFVATQFFVYPERQGSDTLRLCMQPEWNIDRAGRGTREEIARYDELSDQLEGLVAVAEKRYRQYRGEVKSRLQV